MLSEVPLIFLWHCQLFRQYPTPLMWPKCCIVLTTSQKWLYFQLLACSKLHWTIMILPTLSHSHLCDQALSTMCRSGLRPVTRNVEVSLVVITRIQSLFKLTTLVRVQPQYLLIFDFILITSTVPSSTIPVRLVPPEAGLKFLGRVEVFYNDVWGTVCDDRFGANEARVVCGMLNFTGRSCFAGRGRLGRGRGMLYVRASVKMHSRLSFPHCAYPILEVS